VKKMCQDKWNQENSSRRSCWRNKKNL